MCYDEFMKIWGEVDICHLSNDALTEELFETDDDSNLGWQCTSHHGEWVAGQSAGGCGNGNMGNFKIRKLNKIKKMSLYPLKHNIGQIHNTL